MKSVRYTQEMIDRYVREGFWGHPTATDLWARNAQLYPDREAIVDSRTRLTWSQASLLAERLALGFREMGLQRDDVVAMQLPNVVETMLIKAAFLRAGVIALPILMFFRRRELLFALSYVDAVGVITCREFRNFDHAAMIAEMRGELPQLKYHFVVDDREQTGEISVRAMMRKPYERSYPAGYLEGARFAPGEVTQLSMTSGTTGVPKIVQNIEDAAWVASVESAKRWRYTADDTILALAPLGGGPSGAPCFHVAPHVGAKVVLMERFEPEDALALIERERVTVATGVPAQMTMMVKHPNLGKYDLSSLRVFYYAGSVCPSAVAEEIEEKIGARVMTRFGMIDCASIATTDYDDPRDIRWHAVGRPLPSVEVRLVDDDGAPVPPGERGEVVIRGPGCVAGFHKDEERTLQVWGEPEGWYHSGDLGRFDRQGNLYLVGRKKDVIIRGGQNIYPIEVESLLVQHPKVANVTVVSMPDPVMGEKACACVIPQAGEALTFGEMVSFLRAKEIAPYKLPERLELVESFPLGSDGQKILKNLLTEEIVRKMQAEREAQAAAARPSPEALGSRLRAALVAYVRDNPGNRMKEIDNTPIFEEPLVAFADGDDPLFAEFKTIIGAFHLTPREMLEWHLRENLGQAEPRIEAVSVVAFALPIARETRASNRRMTIGCSKRWNHMRWMGQAFGDTLTQHLVSVVEELGGHAVVPDKSRLYTTVKTPDGRRASWSQRHAAYVAGLGTFGLSDGLITAKGTAVRFGTLITDLPLPAQARPYTHHLAHCAFYADRSCDQCIARCPAGAITEQGHDKIKCDEYIHEGMKPWLERHGQGFIKGSYAGCGLCLTKVPCESAIPKAARAQVGSSS